MSRFSRSIFLYSYHKSKWNRNKNFRQEFFLGRSSATLVNRIWSVQQSAIVAEGEVVIVLRDYRVGRSVAFPEVIRAAIEALDDLGS